MSLGPDARSLIDTARDGDEPGPDDAARVRARLARRLGVAAAAGAAVTVSAKSASAVGGSALSVGAKLLFAVAVLGGAAAGVAVFHEPAHVAAAPAVVVGPATTATASTTTIATAPLPEPAPSALPSARPNVEAARAENARPRPEPVDPARERGAPSTPTVHESDALPSHAERVDDAIRESSASPSPVTTAASAEPPAPVVTADTVREEAAILRAAERALAAKDGATALARLDEHAVRFPRGALVEERSAAHVLALCSVGRVTEARTEAQRFLVARPRSPLGAQVRESCAKE